MAGSPAVIDRGASEEDRAEGDARVAELYASGQLDPNDRYINVIRVQFVEQCSRPFQRYPQGREECS
jgi:hypothetical protein